MKRSAAQILSSQISDSEKLELIVTGMSKGDFKFIRVFLDKFESMATQEQRVALVKLYEMGWDLVKVVWNPSKNKMAFSVRAVDCAAWVTPDGKVNRAPVGKRTAYLDSGWVDA